MGEIEKHMPVMLEVVEKLRREIPDLKVVIPAANERAYSAITSQTFQTSQAFCIIRGGARDVLRRADAAVVASGTATLEAALANCPTVLVYRVGWLFAAIARRVIKGVRHVGLANVIAEKAGAECPMPECLQEDFTAENVLSHLRPWLADAAANRAARQGLADTMQLLKTDGDAMARIIRTLLP